VFFRKLSGEIVPLFHKRGIVCGRRGNRWAFQAILQVVVLPSLNTDGALAIGSAHMASSSSWEKDSKSIRWALQASATVWKIPIGQPMQSILLWIKTLIVTGHRRIISSTVISGSIVSGVCTVRVSKEQHLSPQPRQKLCAGANNRRAPCYSPDKQRACRVEVRHLKVAANIPLCASR
jgi:hypothetical protein